MLLLSVKHFWYNKRGANEEAPNCGYKIKDMPFKGEFREMLLEFSVGKEFVARQGGKFIMNHPLLINFLIGFGLLK